MSSRVLDVWVEGEFAGVLEEQDGDVAFAYDDSYRSNGQTPALSISMPKTRPRHGDNVARRWIANLLPDNDEVRDRWAVTFGERRATAYNLLRHMGRDCAGAVQIMPTGESPDQAGDSTPVSHEEIEERLRVLRVDDSAWTFGEHGGRWSLGGAQGKFALAQTADGGWEEPTGRAASTHIFKVGVRWYAHGDLAEFLTMRMAALLEMSVAPTEIRRFGDETALVSQRYDRYRDEATGAVRRLHQEDLCQALGLSRSLNYESDGGPGVETVADLITRAVDPRDLLRARRRFMSALIFNWIVAVTDAHAKNYSLLHLGSRVLMAPLYDLTSSALFEEPAEVEYTARMAMKLGGHYKIEEIRLRHLERAGETLGLDATWVRAKTATFVDAAPAALARALDEIGEVVTAKSRREFSSRMTARIAAAARTLG